MKKFLMLMLAIALAVTAVTCAFAEEATADTAAESWYELDADEGILTVRLPVSDDANLAWSYEISDPAVLELITSETTEATADAPAAFVASFKGTFESAGDVSVKFSNASEDNSVISETRELALFVDEANLIQLVSESVSSETADWCELSEDEATLTVRLPENASTGYTWSCAIDDETLLKAESAESVSGEAKDGEVGVPGEYVLTLVSPMESAGTATVTLTYARADGEPIETRVLSVFVNEAGLLSVSQATVTTDIYVAK